MFSWTKVQLYAKTLVLKWENFSNIKDLCQNILCLKVKYVVCTIPICFPDYIMCVFATIAGKANVRLKLLAKLLN